MSERDDALRLADIVDELDFLADALKSITHEQFARDSVTQKATIYALQVIGEAANHLSSTAQSRAQDIEWPRIIALRNRIAHGYFALEIDAIWRIATEDAPKLRQQLAAAGLIEKAQD